MTCVYRPCMCSANQTRRSWWLESSSPTVYMGGPTHYWVHSRNCTPCWIWVVQTVVIECVLWLKLKFEGNYDAPQTTVDAGAVLDNNIWDNHSKWRRRRRENASGVVYVEGCPIPSRQKGRGSLRALQPGSAGSTFWRNLKATERSLFAPICRCFEFVKQCFMSPWGRGRGEVGGAVATAPRRMARGIRPHFTTLVAFDMWIMSLPIFRTRRRVTLNCTDFFDWHQITL